ncbi:berberine bridge enzyme-like 18 [Triticum dicoccoides]|uniref:berberine bridge enzyme-like 18 n=1 Tax=Triticum dicoccoides TaxID=85692 RepID=UPI00188FE1B4|nr:berberine bridge enzyme-like 18 [Triticum dicoccoides]XP_044393441.1 berberine bridge enzyme-like Cyn d 4 [Triticum aestivum]
MASIALVLMVCFLGLFLPAPSLASTSNYTDFVRCISTSVPSQLVQTPNSPSFKQLLVSSIRNARFVAPATASPPLCIVMPTNASHVQAAVRCGRRHGVRVRVRSGGHDYEGLSYRSVCPNSEAFAVIDLAKLHAVRVDPRKATAWVDSGAALGELYHHVATAAPGLGFPAGVCSTVGVGGILSGGGIGLMMRNRGGGGGNFGIVLSWKVRLVPVPPTVTFFKLAKTMDQGAVNAVTKWQTLAPVLPDDLTVRVIVENRQATFEALYLGKCNAVVPTLRSRFPELGVTHADCKEMSWLQFTAYIYFGDATINRSMALGPFIKNKSDYVEKALTNETWEKIFLWPNDAASGQLVLEPHGGRMGHITANDTPFPHRSSVLYNIQYVQHWNGKGAGGDATPKPNWIGSLYDFMAPFVSKNPRAAYVNYRDLDIGMNTVVGGVTSYQSGKVWGERYFGPANFRRLAEVKRRVDAGDYFRHEQSVPPLPLN